MNNVADTPKLYYQNPHATCSLEFFVVPFVLFVLCLFVASGPAKINEFQLRVGGLFSVLKLRQRAFEHRLFFALPRRGEVSAFQKLSRKCVVNAFQRHGRKREITLLDDDVPKTKRGTVVKLQSRGRQSPQVSHVDVYRTEVGKI